jgi:hypothetical protein
VSVELADKRWAKINGATFILSFIEAVCGYKLEKSQPGWYFFKREVAFE